MKTKILLGLFPLFFSLLACSTEKSNTENRPNIIWLTTEDISPTLSMYGDSTAETPTLDKLACESLIFDRAFTVVGVCAPSRSCLITGMYPTSIGTHNMRTGRDVSGWGSRKYDGNSEARDINDRPIPHYSAVVPEEVRCFTEYLRAVGYYCTNNQKTDYQFAAPVTAWDQNGNDAHWKNRKEGQPFFAVFNHNVTHESRMWMNKNLPLTVDPGTVPLPDYYPENEIVRNDVARNYSNIELLDKQIEKRLKELEQAGLLENTIVFFFSDHGGPLPRGKREHYDSGLKVPLLVRMPGSEQFERISDLVSFVDFAPTVLSLAGIEPPEYLQGQAFLGKYKAETPRKYIHGSGDRFDEFADRTRIVRDKQFLYVKNYYPELPSYKDVAYRKQMDIMMELLRLRDAELLNDQQSYYFRTRKSSEEFYDCEKDPYQLNNLIDNPAHAQKIEELRNELARWQENDGDMGEIPEFELLEEMWPGGIQPVTARPELTKKGRMLTATCQTAGSSIAYLYSDDEEIPDLDGGWKLYTEPLQLVEGKHLFVMANRIGYADSEIVHALY